MAVAGRPALRYVVRPPLTKTKDDVEYDVAHYQVLLKEKTVPTASVIQTMEVVMTKGKLLLLVLFCGAVLVVGYYFPHEKQYSVDDVVVSQGDALPPNPERLADRHSITLHGQQVNLDSLVEVDSKQRR